MSDWTEFQVIGAIVMAVALLFVLVPLLSEIGEFLAVTVVRFVSFIFNMICLAVLWSLDMVIAVWRWARKKLKGFRGRDGGAL